MYFRHIESAALTTGVPASELTRRQFLTFTTLAGSGLTLGILLPGCGTGPSGAGSAGAASGPLAMPFLRIAPDNTVTVISKHLEAGQGVWTGLPAIVGKERLPRLDARAKSTGKHQFAIDVMLPGMMTAVVMRPPRFGAKVSSFDATKAKAVAGVIDVVQIPRGVAVVGRDMWSAKKGREALVVSWDEAGAEKRGTAALMKEYRALGRGNEAVTVAQNGDAEAALAHAQKRVEGEFEFPYLAHAPMEPLTAVCSLSPDKCEIWAGCQFQTVDQMNAAAAVGLKPEQVTINTLAAGGTFGRRATPDSDYISEVASIAKATGGKYPVRLIWTREDDITGGRYRPLNYHRISASVGKDGSVAYRQRVVGQSIIAGTPFAGMMKIGRA